MRLVPMVLPRLIIIPCTLYGSKIHVAKWRMANVVKIAPYLQYSNTISRNMEELITRYEYLMLICVEFPPVKCNFCDEIVIFS